MVGQDPVISAQNSFIADVGKLTDVWLRKDVLYPINGSKPITTWSCVTSSATIQGASLNFMEFEFVFQNQVQVTDDNTNARRENIRTQNIMCTRLTTGLEKSEVFVLCFYSFTVPSTSSLC